MRPYLNTLYVTSQGAWLNKDGANIVITVDEVERGRVPLHTLGAVMGFGRVLISPPLLGACAEAGISVTYLTGEGRFLARVEGPVSGNVLLRRNQYRWSDAPARRDGIVKSIVAGKILNQKTVIARAIRDHSGTTEVAALSALTSASDRLGQIVRRLEKPLGTEELRGAEGEAGRAYFAVFDHLIRGEKPLFTFNGRSRRPPLDAVNAVLSFLYTLLTSDCRAALEAVGLDPAVGYLHSDRPGRPSLALDLMEEFRPFFADRLALSLINRRQLSAKDFRILDNGATLLTDEGRKAVLVAYQERKRDEIQHLFLGEKLTVGLLWFVQAQLLARHIRGDLDAYPPFIWK
ncbi:MAG: subtype I-C CRISPR-associated endonuclease Cas1 [Hyphomicrobium sp. 32-62-53]|nr:MAG: subtype I-C CRISPR-associated endonuclease Cas1 [Hyphomicrobium sp. 12-62-95]OYY01769.1 MAG: subtype I-C CRISPR-associated endonuclease Cas1 [Hyphomicrobium sp. 32-62-53]